MLYTNSYPSKIKKMFKVIDGKEESRGGKGGIEEGAIDNHNDDGHHDNYYL
jgi:hypothetical protein